eukprot:886329-Pleurochrysis_carterae.AAC.1
MRRLRRQTQGGRAHFKHTQGACAEANGGSVVEAAEERKRRLTSKAERAGCVPPFQAEEWKGRLSSKAERALALMLEPRKGRLGKTVGFPCSRAARRVSFPLAQPRQRACPPRMKRRNASRVTDADSGEGEMAGHREDQEQHSG